MFFRALLAFVTLPGVMAFAIPLTFAYYESPEGGSLWLGVPVLTVGLVVLLWCVRDFYVAGKGTLAPWSPPQTLVVVGLYRYVRNPMYVGVLLILAGWSLIFGSWNIPLYAAGLFLAFHLRVISHEEPTLSKLFPEAWSEYRLHVNRWLPRMTGWQP